MSSCFPHFPGYSSNEGPDTPPGTQSSPTSLRISFTEEESQRFQRRWENGYERKHDQRYNHWLKIYHPDYQHTPKAGGFDLTNPSLELEQQKRKHSGEETDSDGPG